MSGFEHYQEELAGLDREIAHYAAICGLLIESAASRKEIEALLHSLPADGKENHARETLQALLILRIRLETEMIELGFSPPQLKIPPR